MKFFKLVLVATTLFSLPLSAYADQKLEKAPKPPTLNPTNPADVKYQTGIGSDTAYASAGVVELGGSLGATMGEDITEVYITPSVGYFFADNFQISVLAGYQHSSVGDSDSVNIATLFLELSAHMPLSRKAFLFGGLGLGGVFQEGVKPGFAFAPRVGAKYLVGRSGMLTASVQPILSINEQDVSSINGTVLSVNSAVNIQFGYTILL